MKKLLILSFAVLVFGSCDRSFDYPYTDILDVNRNTGYTEINLTALNHNLNLNPAENLSQTEINSVLWMREEEKLARDLNESLSENYEPRIFSRMAITEQNHMDAMLLLLEKYELEDPIGSNGTGVFADTELQNMYNDLLANGKTELTEAFLAGAYIQEFAILHRKDAINNQVDNLDISTLYENLITASVNHLRAYVRELRLQGTEYVPQLMTPEQYGEYIGRVTGN